MYFDTAEMVVTTIVVSRLVSLPDYNIETSYHMTQVENNGASLLSIFCPSDNKIRKVKMVINSFRCPHTYTLL